MRIIHPLNSILIHLIREESAVVPRLQQPLHRLAIEFRVRLYGHEFAVDVHALGGADGGGAEGFDGWGVGADYVAVHVVERLRGGGGRCVSLVVLRGDGVGA